MNQDIFRSYDIRGIYPIDIDEAFAEKVGKAFGSYIGSGKKVLVGRDIRKSSPSLSERLIKGVESQGLEITYAGVIPTPVLYFAVSHYKLDGGITVSASHNPPEWNGFKVTRENAHVIGLGSGLERIRDMVIENRFEQGGNGRRIDRSKEIMRDYLDFLSGKVARLDGVRIGIDPGNGAYSGIASETFRGKGAEVFAINDVPDGTFPSRSPEPKESTIGELIELVKSEGLDLGVAFDGDGDRALVVSDTGEVLGGDVLLALFVKMYLNSGEKVAYEVSCSMVVEDMIKEKGGVALLTKVGHSHFKDAMKDQNGRFGGEISGHMYYQELYGNDDGLFTALKAAEMISKSGKRLSELIAAMPRYVNAFEEYDAEDAIKFKVMERITADLSEGSDNVITFEGVKEITPAGWFLLRVSNTTPKIKCRVEAKNAKDLEKLAEKAREEFSAAYGSIKGGG